MYYKFDEYNEERYLGSYVREFDSPETMYVWRNSQEGHLFLSYCNFREVDSMETEDSSFEPSDSEILKWIISAKITIRFDSPQTWTRGDGSQYRTCWQVSSPVAMFATLSTVEETLTEAYKSWHQHKEYRSI